MGWKKIAYVLDNFLCKDAHGVSKEKKVDIRSILLGFQGEQMQETDFLVKCTKVIAEAIRSVCKEQSLVSERGFNETHSEVKEKMYQWKEQKGGERRARRQAGEFYKASS